jgi:hypothetical protein
MAPGKYESELISMHDATNWELPGLDQLVTSLVTLESTMKLIAADPGIKGATGNAVQDSFLALTQQFQKLQDVAKDIQKVVTSANGARVTYAKKGLDALPSAAIPPDVFVKAALGAPFAFPGIPAPIAAIGAIEIIQLHLDAQREASAQGHVQVLEAELNAHTLPEVGVALGVREGSATPDSSAAQNSAQTRPTSHVSGSIGGGANGGGYDAGHAAPAPGGLVGDGLTGGVLVGDGPTAGGTLPGGSFSASGPTGGGLAGVGTGGLIAGAGGLGALAAASRLGAGGGGFAGAGASTGLGSGGLLGSSGKAAAAASTAEPEGAVAGAKPGSSMMGGSGGAGNRGKEKHAGLGGYIAPKLDDDDEFVPRSAGAFAGSRDGAPSTDD